MLIKSWTKNASLQQSFKIVLLAHVIGKAVQSLVTAHTYTGIGDRLVLLSRVLAAWDP